MKKIVLVLLFSVVFVFSSCGGSNKAVSSSSAVSKISEKTTKVSETAKKENKTTSLTSTESKKPQTTVTEKTSSVTETQQLPQDWELEAAKAVNNKFFQYISWNSIKDAKLIAVGTVLEKINTQGESFSEEVEIVPLYDDNCIMNFKESDNQKILNLKFYTESNSDSNENQDKTWYYSTMYYIKGRWLVENYQKLPEE